MPQGPVKFSPSLLASDISRLGDEVRAAVDAGSDYLHLDSMDGHFVPNLTFGAVLAEALRGVAGAPLDCHLMVEEPDRLVPAFAEAGAHIITVHAEAATHLQRTLASIREAGVRAGVALNPHTPLQVIEHVLDDIDLLLIMTVNPGFGGQRFIPAMLPKIEAARGLIDRSGRTIELEVDGGIDPQTAPKAIKAGADVLVAGTAFFRADEPYADRIKRLTGRA